MTMGSIPSPRSKRVLLLTNSEHGQANVYLATSYALLTLSDQDVEVHLASFEAIHKFVVSASQHAEQDNRKAKASGKRPHPHRDIIFHKIAGISMLEAWECPEVLQEQESLSTLESQLTDDMIRAKTNCLMRRISLLLRVTLPWSGPEFVQIFRSVVDIVRDIQPDIIAVDPAFSPALTALRHIGARFLVLSPNTIKDFAMPFQPNGEALWKYPCLGKATPYPVPLSEIPGNIILILVAILISLFFDSRRSSIQKYVHAHASGARLTTLNDLSLTPHRISPTLKFLVANLPQVEFPLKIIPRHIIPCGPMIRLAKPVHEVDADLANWLDRAPTVYINLGTHMRFTEDFAVEMAIAVRILLDYLRSVIWRDESKRLRGLQVLWKLDRKGEYEVLKEGSKVYKILGRDIEKGCVRIVDWIEAEPTAVLDSGRVVCAVHHGGANSFLETVYAGIPQVVLPVWMDTYDFARRAEILGIGRWGNQNNNGKLCKGGELGSILIEVLMGGQWSSYVENAKRLAGICQEEGGGRVKAARNILAEIPMDQGTDQLDGGKSDIDRRLPLLGGNGHVNGKADGHLGRC